LKAAYFSLIGDKYPGFKHKTTLEDSELRRCYFALITDDIESFAAKYANIIQKIKGILLIPGKKILTDKLGENLRVIYFSPAMEENLFLLAEMYLNLLEDSINLRSNYDLLRIESDRTLIQYKRLQGFYESVQEKTRKDIHYQNKWTIGALLKLIEFRNTELLKSEIEDFLKTILTFLAQGYFDFKGVALMKNCQFVPEIVLSIGDIDEAVKEKIGCKSDINWISVFPLNISLSCEHLLIVAKSKDYFFKEYEKSFFLLFSEIVVAAYKEKLNEQALFIAKEDAESANRMKTQFMANMSHELRNPLNGILGMIGLIKSSGLNTLQLQQISLLEYSSNSLLSIINDLLDFSSIEKGKFKLCNDIFNPGDLLEKTINIFKIPANDKGLSLRFINNIGSEYRLKGDSNRLQQILINFISNAIKYSDHGEIVVKQDIVNENDAELTCRFSVSDNGIGIPEDKYEAIFAEFVQLEETYLKSHQGLGLGLAIVKSIAQMMNGKIDVRSKIDEGSTFSIDIPLKKIPEDAGNFASTNYPIDSSMKKYKILVAEDDIINLIYLEQAFLREGHYVDKAKNGLEVLRLLDKRQYDIIFMDIGMPKMNGLECIKQIRKRNIKIPAFALSGYTSSKDIESFILAGFDNVLSKPITINKLLSTISSASEYWDTTKVEI